MALTTVLTILDLAVKTLPVLIETGVNLKPFAESLFKQFKGDELTDEERSELYAAVDAQYEKAMRPQSPAQPGDPDYSGPA
jgi:hypothetical protein